MEKEMIDTVLEKEWSVVVLHLAGRSHHSESEPNQISVAMLDLESQAGPQM
jgi:hypothetical protein